MTQLSETLVFPFWDSYSIGYPSGYLIIITADVVVDALIPMIWGVTLYSKLHLATDFSKLYNFYVNRNICFI